MPLSFTAICLYKVVNCKWLSFNLGEYAEWWQFQSNFAYRKSAKSASIQWLHSHRPKGNVYIASLLKLRKAINHFNILRHVCRLRRSLTYLVMQLPIKDYFKDFNVINCANIWRGKQGCNKYTVPKLAIKSTFCFRRQKLSLSTLATGYQNSIVEYLKALFDVSICTCHRDMSWYFIYTTSRFKSEQ